MSAFERLQIVIPMAGAGQRFVDAGYALPKPLIPIAGVPMVVRAVRDLPEVKRLIFLCLRAHIEDHQVDRVLRRFFPRCEVVPVDALTGGQACTARLAAPWLNFAHPVLIAACDNSHLYEGEKLANLLANAAIDASVWCYSGEPRVLVKPEMYGWIRAAANGDIEEVGVKRPLSAAPLHDRAISGAFTFRTAGLMIEAIDRLVNSGRTVNGEYYLDSTAALLLEEGRRVVAFDVEKYIGWGTPADLEDYHRWRRHFDLSTAKHPG